MEDLKRAYCDVEHDVGLDYRSILTDWTWKMSTSDQARARLAALVLEATGIDFTEEGR